MLAPGGAGMTRPERQPADRQTGSESRCPPPLRLQLFRRRHKGPPACERPVDALPARPATDARIVPISHLASRFLAPLSLPLPTCATKGFAASPHPRSHNLSAYACAVVPTDSYQCQQTAGAVLQANHAAVDVCLCLSAHWRCFGVGDRVAGAAPPPRIQLLGILAVAYHHAKW